MEYVMSHSSRTIRVAAPIHIAYYGRSSGRSVKLKPGFFLSNEPGYYKEGDFGVRLENILEVIPANRSVCFCSLYTFLYRIIFIFLSVYILYIITII